MRTRWPIRGGVTAITGWVLVLLGVVGSFESWTAAAGLIATIQANSLPIPPAVSTADLLLAFVCPGFAAGGILLLGFAGPERNREEELILDPLKYEPFRHPWRKALPWFAVVLVLLPLPGMWLVPIAHSVQGSFAVTDCSPGETGLIHYVSVPAGAYFAYQWSSSDGRPIDEVSAPSGAQVSSSWSSNSIHANEFFNSSYGYSAIQGNGSAIPFWACDFVSAGPSNQSVEFSGSYYTSIL